MQGAILQGELGDGALGGCLLSASASKRTKNLPTIELNDILAHDIALTLQSDGAHKVNNCRR